MTWSVISYTANHPSTNQAETFTNQVTAMIITYNEEANIERTLQALSWVKDILVIDSGSTDATLSLIGTHPQARVAHRPFDTFANQCNFGLTQVRTRWVLSLDADYELSETLSREIQTLSPEGSPRAYQASFIYRIYGRPLRATLYPPSALQRRGPRAQGGRRLPHRIAPRTHLSRRS
jgi:glycosyltransferase involved in cell wall biosynthesis